MWKRFGLLTQSLGTDDMLSTDMPFSEVDLQIVVEAFKFPVDAADVMPDMDDADAMLTCGPVRRRRPSGAVRDRTRHSHTWSRSG